LKDCKRVMLVITKHPARSLKFASSEVIGLPSRDVAHMAAQLLKLGAEVRIIDQNADGPVHRVVRREMKLWRADLVLLWAGGSLVANEPLPDERLLVQLLAGWSWPAPVLACGPLAIWYGEELLRSIPRLDGVFVGPVTEALAGGFDEGIPGVGTMQDGSLNVVPFNDVEPIEVLPAWQLLPLDSYAHAGFPFQRMVSVRLQGSVEDTLKEVRHAVRRANARSILIEDRDMGHDADLAEAVARKMFGAAPGVPWVCRLQADRATPPFVLALSRGGCQEVLVVSPSFRDVAGQTPMDDPDRPRFEGAVDAVRVTGMTACVQHVVGRPGHSRPMLSAWQRWFADRRIAVRPEVLLQHAGARGPGSPSLAESRRQAGCWENSLTPSDVERAVKRLTAKVKSAGSLS
jgi:hypothetical protein